MNSNLRPDIEICAQEISLQEDLKTWQNLLNSYKRINQLLEESISSIKTTDISSKEIQQQ